MHLLGLTDRVKKTLKTLHVSAYIYITSHGRLCSELRSIRRVGLDRCFSYIDAATNTATWMHRVSVYVKVRHSQIELSPFLPCIIFLMPCCQLWYVRCAETHAGRLTRGSGAGRYSQINKSGPWRGSVITVRGRWDLLWNLLFLSGKNRWRVFTKAALSGQTTNSGKNYNNVFWKYVSVQDWWCRWTEGSSSVLETSKKRPVS